MRHEFGSSVSRVTARSGGDGHTVGVKTEGPPNMRRFERLDEPMHAYLLIDESEMQRTYGEHDRTREREHLRRAVVRATICLVLLFGGLAATGALHGWELAAGIHATTKRG